MQGRGSCSFGEFGAGGCFLWLLSSLYGLSKEGTCLSEPLLCARPQLGIAELTIPATTLTVHQVLCKMLAFHISFPLHNGHLHTTDGEAEVGKVSNRSSLGNERRRPDIMMALVSLGLRSHKWPWG